MARALSPILRHEANGRVAFRCPGCGSSHSIPVRIHVPALPVPDPLDPDWTPPREFYEARDGCWAWNGSASKPTFQPSLLTTYQHMSAAGRARCAAFSEQHGREPTHKEIPYDVTDICHSFVTDGRLQFLADCTHALKGQTVDIPPWPVQPEEPDHVA